MQFKFSRFPGLFSYGGVPVPFKAPGFLQVRLYPQSQHAFHSGEHRNAADKKEGGVLCSSLGWQTGGLFCAPCLNFRLHKNCLVFGVGGMQLEVGPWFYWYIVSNSQSIGRLLRSFIQGRK